MGKKGRDTGKVDNGLKERLRANMKAKKKGNPCYAFGMALNPKMRSVLGEEHRALLVVKSGDPDIDLYIRSLFATGGCGQYSKDSVEDGENHILEMAALKKVVPPLQASEILKVDSATLKAACEDAVQLKVTSSVCAVMENVAQDRRGVVKELSNLVKACTLTRIFDASFTSEVIVKAGGSGTVVFIQFVGQEARDEFVRRFQLQHRGQDEHFRKIKAPDAEEIKAANARSGAAFDRALRLRILCIDTLLLFRGSGWAS